MAIIKQPNRPLTRSTQATLFGAATAAALLIGAGTMLSYAGHALSIAGSLARLGEHAWLSLVAGVGGLWLSVRSAREAWRGEWPIDEEFDAPFAELDAAEPTDAELDYLGRFAAWYDPGASDADDKKPDEDSST